MRCHPKLCSSGGYDQGTSPIVWQESKVLAPARQLCTRHRSDPSLSDLRPKSAKYDIPVAEVLKQFASEHCRPAPQP